MRRRVLLVTPLPPPAGGVATWAERVMASHLAERFELAAVNTNPGKDSGVNARKIGTYLRIPVDLYRRLATFRPDLVHVNSGSRMPHVAYEAAALIPAIRRSGARSVLHFRGTTVGAMLDDPLSRRVIRHLVRRVDAVFALNRGEVAALGRAGAANRRQVNNFVPGRPWRDRPPHDGPMRLLYVGWVMREKGLFELVEALAQVAGVTLDVVGRFTKLGGGSCEAELRAHVARHGVADRVRFVGEVPLARIFEHYDSADAFVLPSWTEGFPNVLVEAMVSGLPSVCTPVGAIPEVLVDGETGILAPLRDKDALAHAIRRMVDEPDVRRAMGRAAWERTMACYERDAVLSRIGDAWDAVIDGRPLGRASEGEPGC